MRKPALPMFGVWAAFLGIALLGDTQSFALASTLNSAPDLCYSAAQTASEKTGVPVSVLIAITLTETGRRTDTGFKPWPWAVNQAGKGHWFSTANQAIEFAESQLDLGLRNFDVGCFQLNHRWHSKGFRSTADMFDPTSNAVYAAGFLAELFTEKGDWSLAAAAYHSRTPEHADRYQAKFDEIYADLGDAPLQAHENAVETRVNRFPLLQAGAKARAGSLVPLLSNATPLFGTQP